MPQRAFLLTAVFLAGWAGAAGAASSRSDANLQPSGSPVDCVDQSQIRETRVLGDSDIDFVLTGRRVYRNHLPDACPELGREKSFIHKSSIDSYCSGDLITVFRDYTPGVPGATCAIGTFQPMTSGGAAH